MDDRKIDPHRKENWNYAKKPGRPRDDRENVVQLRLSKYEMSNLGVVSKLFNLPRQDTIRFLIHRVFLSVQASLRWQGSNLPPTACPDYRHVAASPPYGSPSLYPSLDHAQLAERLKRFPRGVTLVPTEVQCLLAEYDEAVAKGLAR